MEKDMSALSEQEKEAVRMSCLRYLAEHPDISDAPLEEAEPTGEDLARLTPGMLAFPDDETLIRFADGSLKARERGEIQAVANRSVLNSLTIGDFVHEYTPIRDLERSWLGWKGPWLSANGSLPEGIAMQEWRRHLARCRRVRYKENFLRLASLQFQWIDAEGLLRRFGVSTGLGLACQAAALAALVLLAVFPRSTFNAPAVIGIRGGGEVPSPRAPVLKARDLSTCTDEELKNAINKLEGRKQKGATPKEYSDLALLYMIRATRSTEPEEKAEREEYLLRANEAARAAGLLQK